MRRFYNIALAAALLVVLASPAFAQQADPAHALVEEWATIVASDTLTAAAHKHTAELAQKLVADYGAKLDELKKAKDELAADEARLATAMNWLKAAQAGQAGQK